MAKHSTLTNADDLHYAKVRVFSGDPNGIYADFADQLLIASDTNKIYRSLGVGLGQLVQLSAVDGDVGAPNASTIEIGDGQPNFFPSAIGQTYFDRNDRRLYLAMNLSEFGWSPIESGLDIRFELENTSSASDSDLSMSLLYLPVNYLPNGFSFDSSFVIQSGISVNAPTGSVDQISAQLTNLIKNTGTGCYALAYEYFGSDSVNLGISFTSPSNDFIMLDSGFTYEGYPISDYYLRINAFPKIPTPISVRFAVVDL